MPGYAVKVCTYTGCNTLVRNGSGRCSKHPAKPWVHSTDAPKRMSGRHLQNARERLFRANPLCVECAAQGKVKLATQRDHVVPLAEGGVDDDSNVQGLCVACHKLKSDAEMRRGVKRSWQ